MMCPEHRVAGEADPSLSNHCECGAPMLVLVNYDGLWVDGCHDQRRETWSGLAAALDAHHKAELCIWCNGTDDFDVAHHYGDGIPR